MKPSLRVVRAIVLCASLIVIFCGFASAQFRTTAQVRSVEIAPQWGGLRQPTEVLVTIEKIKGSFYRRIVDSSLPDPDKTEDQVQRELIAALIRAMQEPPEASPQLANLGITRSWLEQNAREQTKYTGTLGEENGQKQQDYFRKAFTDPVLVQKLLPRIMFRWSDDYPRVHVCMTFSDGVTWTVESDNQPPFMLPWTTRVNGKANHTYNANISRAIAALLPAGTVNRDRLSGVGLEERVRRAVESSISAEWHRIGAEDRAGTALSQIRKKYRVRRCEVNTNHGLSWGTEWKQGVTPETSLQADVFLPNYPRNLAVAAVFPIRDEKTEGVESFLKDGGKYEQLVLSNPWLMKSLRSHPDLGAWLHFSEGRSLSDKALRILTADMHLVGRDDLAEEISAHRNEVALLSYYGSVLVLFSDHHAIVWRWSPQTKLFDWSASSLKTQRCSEYQTVTEGCVAAVITPDGSLKR